jgi:thioredoxin
METLSLETFREKVFDFEKNRDWKYEGQLPAIVDFYADWCGPCRRLSPILEELAREYAGQIEIYKIDTEASPELAAMFGIMSIPSLLFIPLNERPQMAAGALPKEALKDAINEVLKVPPPLVLG